MRRVIWIREEYHYTVYPAKYWAIWSIKIPGKIFPSQKSISETDPRWEKRLRGGERVSGNVELKAEVETFVDILCIPFTLYLSRISECYLGPRR